MQVPLSGPDITEKEINAVVEVLRSGVLSIGPRLEEFENKIATFVGVKHAIGVNSGTSGLHLAVRALGISDGDEVITTPFSFIASSNCILFERATPIFVDIDPLTLNIDVDRIESAITPRTKALLPVDAFGQPVDIEAIKSIAAKYGLPIIEDACEALGAEFNGIKAGSQADIAVFAFYPNKQITTAEGGMVVTNDDHIADLVRSMRSQGRPITGLWLEHERLGYNYRMSELHAALGCVQMDRIDEIISKRQRVAEMYNSHLSEVEEVSVPYVDPRVKMSWFIYVVRFHASVNRDKVMEYLIEHGVGCKPYFTPIHLQAFYREMGFNEGDFPVTESVAKTTLALPFFSNMTEEQIDYVVKTLKEGIAKAKR